MTSIWQSGDAYENFVGRWSRRVAEEFLDWLSISPGGNWLDVGCGTGELTRAILERCDPLTVTGLDPSPAFLAHAINHTDDARADFHEADAQVLPFPDDHFHATVSGLVLNFVPDPALALSEAARVTRPGGVVAAYVWDYAGKMELIRYFFDAAIAIDPAAADVDEARFTICNPMGLADLFRGARLRDVDTRAIDVTTRFRDFDDYWTPFLARVGVAPAYALSLSEPQREALRERLRGSLPVEPDGSINLVARAWAVRGTN